MSRSTAFDKKFEAALSRIDFRRVRRDLDDLRAALKRSTASWRLVEPTVARLKLDNTIDRREALLVTAILRQAVKESRRGLTLVRRAFADTLQPSGILNVIASGAREIAPRVRMQSLPPLEAAELRAASLTDVEALHLLRIGIREYRTTIARTRRVDVSAHAFRQADAILRSIERWNQNDWRQDILEGNSGWEVIWDGIKIVAGGVIVVADVAGAVETAGAAVVSIASGLAVYADGMHDLKNDAK